MTEAAPGVGHEVLAPYVDHILSVFGPARTMWGSDWPVVLGASSYAHWDTITQDLLVGMRAADREQVLGTSCARFYGLPETTPSSP
jgi:L-fuconolactonase